MTWLAGLLIGFNSAICLLLFIRKRRINSPFQFFYLLLFGLGVFPSFFDLQVGTYEFHPFAPPIYLTPDTIMAVHAKIAAMLLTFALFEAIVDTRNRTIITLPTTPAAISVYDAMVGAIILFLFAGIWAYGFGELATQSFGDLRFGETSTYSLILFYLQVMIVGLPAVYFLKADRKVTAAAILGLFAITYLFLGGSRQTIMLSLIIILAMALVGRGRWAYLLLIVAFSVGFSFADIILQSFKALRNLPSFEQRILLLGDLIAGRATLEGVSSESALRFVMYGFLHEAQPADFGSLEYFRRALLFWLPSSLDIAGLKPPDFEATMFAEAMGNRVGTMHAIFFGSVYADAGMLFLVWIGWFVLGFRLLEYIMVRLRPLERAMVWSSCIYLSFMAARGSLYAPLVITATVLLLAWLSHLWSLVFDTSDREPMRSLPGRRIPELGEGT
jgi:hypothetical protein